MTKKHIEIIDEPSEQKESIPSFGNYLRTEREKMELTLEDVYRITKIQVKFLEALENDRFGDLPVPAPVLIKGYIRSIAEAIGLQPAAVVEKYTEYLSELDGVAAAKEEARKAPKKVSPNALPVQNILRVALLITLGIILLVAGLFFLFPAPPAQVDGENTQATTEETTSATEVEPSATETGTPQAPAEAMTQGQAVNAEPGTDVQQMQPANGNSNATEADFPIKPLNREDGINFVLQFYILNESWFRVKVDNEEPKNYLLRNKTEMTFSAKKEILIDIGRVSATELIVNGVNIEYPQPESEILNGFVINKDTVGTFQKRTRLLDRSKEVPPDVMEKKANDRFLKELKQNKQKSVPKAEKKTEDSTSKPVAQETAPQPPSE